MKLKAWKTAMTLAVKKAPRKTEEFEKLPEHVAIIMDGNGRWAKKHRLNVSGDTGRGRKPCGRLSGTRTIWESGC